MKCPKCGGKTRVYRTETYDQTIKRTRLCIHCGHRMETWESVDRADETPMPLEVGNEAHV